MKSVLLIIFGVFLGWLTVPTLAAGDAESNTYKGLLKRVIEITTQVQISSAQTAENTRILKEHFVGVKK